MKVELQGDIRKEGLITAADPDLELIGRRSLLACFSSFCDFFIRLSIIRVTGRICCWPADNRHGHAQLCYCCAGLHLWFCSAQLCCFVFGLPPPTCLLVHGGPLCPCKYTYFPLRIQCNKYQGKVTHGRLPWLLLHLLFAHTHLLIACVAVNWHVPSILNIAYRQVNPKQWGDPPRPLPQICNWVIKGNVKEQKEGTIFFKESQGGERHYSRDGPFSNNPLEGGNCFAWRLTCPGYQRFFLGGFRSWPCLCWRPARKTSGAEHDFFL